MFWEKTVFLNVFETLFRLLHDFYRWCMEIMNEISGYLSSDPPSPSNRPNGALRPSDSSSDEGDDSPNGEGTSTASAAGSSLPIAKSGVMGTSSVLMAAASSFSSQRCEFIPMRLTEHERKLLQVFENALEVCEYTDVVDVTFSHTRKSKQSRILESLVDILSISCGLLVSAL